MGILDDVIPDVVSDVLGVLTDTRVSYTRTPKPVYDMRTGEEYAEDPTVYSILMAPPFPYTVGYVAGTGTPRRELVTLISKRDLPVEPDPDTDTLVYGGVTYRVADVGTIVAGDTPGVWTVTLRK